MTNQLNIQLLGNAANHILLLRHGAVETTGGSKRFIGQSDPALSEIGRRQANHWRDRLSKIPLDRILSSDLRRCVDTADIIATKHAVPITPRSELREIDLGQWEGLSFDEVKQRWPNAFRQRGAAIDRFRPPDGESFMDLQERVIPVFEETVGQTKGNMLIVAHAGVNRTILCHLLGVPLNHLLRIAQGWGALNLVERRFDGYRLHAVNLLPPLYFSDVPNG